MVVGYCINMVKITFDFNFDLYQAFKQHGYTKHENNEKVFYLKKHLFNYLKICNSKKACQKLKLKYKSRLHYINIIAYIPP